MVDNKNKILVKIKNSKILKDISKVSLLGKGGFSDCYLIQTKKKTYVLKFRRDNQLSRLEREFNLLTTKSIADNDVAPKVYKFDKSCKKFKFPYLLEEYIQGIHPNKTKTSLKFIKAMAKKYSQLHLTTSKKTDNAGRDEINSTVFWSKKNYAQFQKQKNYLEKNVKQDLETFYDFLLKICKENDKILQRKVYNLIQCDPSKENIFITKNGEIRLIDWDFAGYHLFERDLILFSDIYHLNNKQEQSFLKYYGIDPASNFMKKYLLIKLLLLVGDINWLLSQKAKDQKKITQIIKKCLIIAKQLEKIRYDS